ncbi:MAG: FKBP-type peptidyl-prolyl cis-trans isomerase [Paludibacteraceae bacterium]|jgi:FKBP-type peptidyl-prolyl cis-trans isomerase SlyD|nr:FKBP-type peptidyl-prolyl cis-trans isomerase [Paludibacteraceae bacterium]MBP9039944.1 FKBP-type peptidyl-prolyl cis-trans isomerase [Paludibacteraceae bacterium]MDI9537599.1 FKBP-type peptidyl-prolyl cis-trans isomerase [Bacteroidota bacterium]HHT60874.1 peptidylprolyl isomerase [Bacteroidales bacterium]
MKISENKLVTLQYKLYVKNDNNELELMEETTEKEPLRFFYGMGMMLPKFEENLLGLSVGDKFNFTLTAEEAYGTYDEENLIDLPRNVFAKDGVIDEKYIFPGAIVPLIDAEGNRINSEVVEIKENEIRMDFNHPLAGEELTFTGEITEVKQPTDEELKAMSHSCCNCSHDCNDDSCSSGCCH